MNEVEHSSRRNHHVWIVPMPVNPLRYIDDLQYFEGASIPRIVGTPMEERRTYSLHRLLFWRSRQTMNDGRKVC